MPLNISYMGTKRVLAPKVAELVAECPNGPLLDIFSGLCAVGTSVGASRGVWSNDLQHFAWNVAKAFFTSSTLPPTPDDAGDQCLSYFKKNRDALEGLLLTHIKKEDAALTSTDCGLIGSVQASFPYLPEFHGEIGRQDLADSSDRFPYRLFSLTYSGTYLGLSQCIAVDSLKYAFDALLREGEVCADLHRWMTLALCQAISKCSTSTGHFAQFLTPNTNNRTRFAAQRRRSIWNEWRSALGGMSPIGTRTWRGRNRAYQMDALELLSSLKEQKARPSVVYADPPYSSDQYSRYYHLYETVFMYDYPKTTGKARYRDGRMTSTFSLATKAEASLRKLIDQCANLKSALILSYPEKGLVKDSEEKICRFFRNSYGRPAELIKFDHVHSTMGASKGAARSDVTEILYFARAS